MLIKIYAGWLISTLELLDTKDFVPDLLQEEKHKKGDL